MSPWSPNGWRELPNAHPIDYPDEEALARAVARLARLPPLVTSFEIERLRSHLAEAQLGKRFVLQGGDCAETMADCEDGPIARKVKILLQMSMVLVQAMEVPVVRIGRFAGQYAKPRSSKEETRGGVTLPNYFGDLINDQAFDEAARTPNPERLVEGYKHAALTLNFIRSLVDGGFADLANVDRWDLSFLESATLSPQLKTRYERITERVRASLRFVGALSAGDPATRPLGRAPFFTSHEGLNLHYEEAQTRQVPHRDGWYVLSAHLPWIGNRTRGLGGAHVDFFRGVRNPLGVKVGSDLDGDELVALLDALNPAKELGRMSLITRFGADKVESALPGLVEAARASGHPVLWVCDPMHGNTRVAKGGLKTRSFEDITRELSQTRRVHEALGSRLGGLHIELTGDDVTECTGGADGLTDDDLRRNYASACDPRLNYRQAMELGFALAELEGSYARPFSALDD